MKFIYLVIVGIDMFASGIECVSGASEPAKKSKFTDIMNFFKSKTPKKDIDDLYVLNGPNSRKTEMKPPSIFLKDWTFKYGPHFKANNMLLISLDHLQQPHAQKLKLVRGIIEKKFKYKNFEGKILPLKPYGTFTQHTSMVTGVSPAEHGVTKSNGIKWDDNKVKLDAFCYDTYKKHFKNNNIVPLWELFKKKPTRISRIYEGMFRHPQVASYAWPGVTKEWNGSALDYFEGFRPLKPPNNFTVIDYANQILKQIERTRNIVVDIWSKYYMYNGVPELSMIYFPSLDEFYHIYSSKEEVVLNRIIEALDIVLSEIINAYLELEPNTTVMIVGDHGGVDVPKENFINIEPLLKKYNITDSRIGATSTMVLKSLKEAEGFVAELNSLYQEKFESITTYSKDNSESDKDEVAVVIRAKGNYLIVNDRGAEVLKNSNEHQYGTPIDVRHMNINQFTRPEDNMESKRWFMENIINVFAMENPKQGCNLTNEDKVMASYYLLFGERVRNVDDRNRHYINGNVTQVYTFVVELFSEFWSYWNSPISHDTAKLHESIPHKEGDTSIGRDLIDDTNWRYRLDEFVDPHQIPV